MELFTSGYIFLVTGIFVTIFILGVPLFIQAPKGQPTIVRIISITLSVSAFSIGAISIFLQASQTGVIRPISLFSTLFTILAPMLLICFFLQGVFIKSIRTSVFQVETLFLFLGLCVLMGYGRWGFNAEIQSFYSNSTQNIGIKVAIYRNFLLFLLSLYLFYEIKKIVKKDYLLKLLQGFCGLQMMLAIAWSALLMLDHVFQLPFFASHDRLLESDLNIRFVRLGFFCISEVLLSIYWAQNYSLNALKERESREKIQELLTEKDLLIEKLANSSALIESGALSAGLAHELNQYLARIQLNSDEAMQLISQASVMPADLKQPLSNILKANHLASKLIISLKKLFNRAEENVTPCSIDDLMREVLLLYAGRIQKSQIQVKVDLQARGHQSVRESLLRQVLVNLLSNAIDSLEASLQNEKWIHIQSSVNAQGNYSLEITDNGPGIHPDQQARLFSLFASSKVLGTGVGLWLSKYIVERHQGSLTYHNFSDGKGVVFKVIIPASLKTS